MSDPLVFENIRPRVDANLKERRRKLMQLLDRDVIQWGARLRKFSYLPGFLENLYVAGQHKLPGRDRPAPIMAFSHKKFHDVWVLAEYFLGRPVEQFHDVAAVIQAGVHTPIYPWRDLFPRILKKGPLRRPATAMARALGGRIADFFQKVHTLPVFREGLDVPESESDYRDAWAGQELLGMDYDEFQRHANRVTMQSVVEVQKRMIGNNACLIIAPEGRYKLDGSVSEIQGLLGMVALRKERDVFLLSLSYDELCADRLGRINAFVNISDAQKPPAAKGRIPAYLRGVREGLQTGTVATASHLIASLLREHLGADRVFSREDLVAGLGERFARLTQWNAPYDPGLREADYREERVKRFWRRYRKRWLIRRGRGYSVSPEKIERFDAEQRTVNDIEWNCNNLTHLPGMSAHGERRGGQSWIAWLRGLG